MTTPVTQRVLQGTDSHGRFLMDEIRKEAIRLRVTQALLRQRLRARSTPQPRKESDVKIMFIKAGTTEAIDVLGCFYDFRPEKGQTVREWCERYGYDVLGNDEDLKKLFGDALVHIGLTLSPGEKSVLDSRFS